MPDRKLYYTIGGFLVIQAIFFVTDGTIVAPNANRMGNFAMELAGTKFFTDWLSFYENPIYRLVTAVALLQVLFTTIYSLATAKNRGSHSIEDDN